MGTHRRNETELSWQLAHGAMGWNFDRWWRYFFYLGAYVYPHHMRNDMLNIMWIANTVWVSVRLTTTEQHYIQLFGTDEIIDFETHPNPHPFLDRPNERFVSGFMVNFEILTDVRSGGVYNTKQIIQKKGDYKWYPLAHTEFIPSVDSSIVMFYLRELFHTKIRAAYIQCKQLEQLGIYKS